MFTLPRRAWRVSPPGRRWSWTVVMLVLAACSESLSGPTTTTPERQAHADVPTLPPAGATVQAAAAVGNERQVIVNRSHTSPWAYHTTSQSTQAGERWYISRIRRDRPGNTYSLGPIQDGKAAWWTIGTDIAAFDAAVSRITFPPNLDTDPSDTFWDAGLGRMVTDPRIHSDRRGLQGRVVSTKWYFFQAANGFWYIVNAPSYGTFLTVLRFDSKGGAYDWQPVDVSGVTATFTPASDGNGMVIVFAERPMPVLSSAVWLPGGSSTVIQLAQYNSNAPIDPARPTWVLVHGRLNGPVDMYLIAAAIRPRRLADQILMLNWEAAARQTDDWKLFSKGEQWIEPVGKWAARMLMNQGFRGENINLVGHSWGAYVADEFAEAIGRVNLQVALDPAANTIGSRYNPNDLGTINFRAHSRLSLAFHSSSWYGNERTPGSAHEAFSVAFYQPVGDVSQSNRHSWIKDLFVGLLSVQGAVSDHFSLQRLLAGTAGPWQSDRYQSDEAYGAIWPATKRYEGLIVSGPASRSPRELRYFSTSGVEQIVSQ